MQTKNNIKDDSQANLIIVAKKLIAQYPRLYKDLVESPSLNDFSKIENVIYFLEKEQCLNAEERCGWEWQLKGREKSEFIYRAMAVIIMLYDPEFFKIKKKLRHGLRAILVYHFKVSGSSISDRLQVIKNLMEIYPFYSGQVHDWAKNYKEQFLNKH